MPSKESQLKTLCNQAVIDNISVAQWLSWLEHQFDENELYFGHGTDSAWDEAVHLVLQALQWPIDTNQEALTKNLDLRQRQAIGALAFQRLLTRKPLPYLTHQAWFMGLPFYVDERVLVPRSPFGEWIERQFTPWVDPDSVQHILEIGTGSGCMAIAAALAFPQAKVVAVDIDSEALSVATINVERYELQDRVQLIQSDCFANVPDHNFDIIMSNPPYVGAGEMQDLPEEYRHEPRGALETEEEGLAIVARILQQASGYLNQDGILVVEVGNSDEALQQRYPQVPFIWLEQERGGHGLFLMTKALLEQHSPF